jgi:hypothetical protein
MAEDFLAGEGAGVQQRTNRMVSCTVDGRPPPVAPTYYDCDSLPSPRGRLVAQ